MRRVLRHNGPFKCLISGTFFLNFSLSLNLTTTLALLQCMAEDVTNPRSSFYAPYSRGFPPFIVHEVNKARRLEVPVMEDAGSNKTARVFSKLLKTLTSSLPSNLIATPNTLRPLHNQQILLTILPRNVEVSSYR